MTSRELCEGALAPDFTLPRDGGGEITLSALRGGPVVLYFYPRDDTSGCTRQAVGFTERLEDFEAAGARVIGVSRDSVASHDKFRDKHRLRVVLASDESGETCEAYDVWKQKNMYGRTYMGIERATFLIDGQGKLRKIWRKVKVPGHIDATLDAITKL